MLRIDKEQFTKIENKRCKFLIKIWLQMVAAVENVTVIISKQVKLCISSSQIPIHNQEEFKDHEKWSLKHRLNNIDMTHQLIGE